jgi:uncharacterized protein (TIGR02145 family)
VVQTNPATFSREAGIGNKTGRNKQSPERARRYIMKKVIILLALASTAVFAQQKGTFKDTRDGKTYKTVKIGKQTWMAENLNYAAEGSKCGGTGNLQTKVHDGSGGGYTSYPLLDENTKNCDKYGRLYNWSGAMAFDSNCLSDLAQLQICYSQVLEKHTDICPDGWHVPSNEEWNVLVNFAGGEKTAGSKLKAKSGWSHIPCNKYSEDEDNWGECIQKGKEKSGNGSDIYGFGALSGGFGGNGMGGSINSGYDGFLGAGESGSWLSASGDFNTSFFLSYRLMMESTSSNVYLRYGLDSYSIRCLQN